MTDDHRRLGLDRHTPEGATIEFVSAVSRAARDPRTRGRLVVAFVLLPVVLVVGPIWLGTIFG